MKQTKLVGIGLGILGAAIATVLGAWQVPPLLRQAEPTKQLNEVQTVQPAQTALTRVAQAVAATGVETREKTKQIVRYADWVKVYQPTQAQQDEISQMIANGADVHALIDICVFWEDTNEPFSLVSELYAECPPSEVLARFDDNLLWITDAYDRIRDKEEEALTLDEIADYRKRGLSLEDIRIADRMSRSGSDIRVVLEEKASGETWQQIILPEMAQAASLTSEVQSDVGGNDLLDSLILARKTGRPATEFLALAQENMTVMEAYQMERTAHTLEELADVGLVREEVQQ